MKNFKLMFLGCFCFISYSIFSQIQKGNSIMLDKSMQSILRSQTHQLSDDGNKIVFGDKGTCKVYDFKDTDWKFASQKWISSLFLDYVQTSVDGKTVVTIIRDSLKVFDIKENETWHERPTIPDFIFPQFVIIDVKISSNGKNLAIHIQNQLQSSSKVKWYSYIDGSWQLNYQNEYFTQYLSHIHFDSSGENLLFTDEYRNYVIVINKKNNDWQETKLLFRNVSNTEITHKLYTQDAKKCVEFYFGRCENRNLEIIEFHIENNEKIIEKSRQTLNVCSNGYHVMSGDGNTIAISNGDAINLTMDTVWVFKRNSAGYFVLHGSPLQGPGLTSNFGLGMSLDFYGQTLSVLVTPDLPNDGNKTLLNVYDLNKTNSTIKNDDGLKNIYFFPNPTNGQITIKDGWKINKIYNTTGYLVKEISEALDFYDLSDLSSGIYYLQIQNDSKIEYHKITKI